MKARHISILLFSLLVLVCSKPVTPEGGPDDPPAPPAETAVDLAGYRIVYSASAEDEEGKDLAASVQETVKAKIGKTLSVTTDDAPETACEILLGKTNRSASKAYYAGKPGIFDYRLSVTGGKVLIAGGGCWAMEKANSLLKANKLVEGLEKSGSVYGEQLFPRESGSNLRLFDDNIWSYNKTSVPAAWSAVGADCTNAVRCVGFAGLVFAYMPDVVCFQEYAKDMDALLRPRLESKGYKMAYTPGNQWDYTPILYNSKTLTLEHSEYLRYTPSTFSDSGSKSYTAAVFSLKSNGKRFAVISTHLWWKSESAQEGSNAAREAQAGLVLACAQKLALDFGCPVFAMGDMNCTLLSNAMKVLTGGGMQPLFNIATVYGDMRNGYHACSADGFSRSSNKSNDGFGCIDHMFLYNAGATEVKTFWRIQPYFTVELTDHYPNYADIVIN